MFHVSVTTPNVGNPIVVNFGDKETAEQYIVNVAVGVASRIGDEEFIKRVDTERDNVDALMALLEEVDVSVVSWED